jgi:hypothetical protein
MIGVVAFVYLEADDLAARAGLDSASANHRSSVATDTPISRDNRVISALSGGTKRATVIRQCPNYYRAIEAATTVTQGDGMKALAALADARLASGWDDRTIKLWNPASGAS